MFTAESAVSATLGEPTQDRTGDLLARVNAASEPLLASETGNMTMIQYLNAVQKLLKQGRLQVLTPEQTRANRKLAREAAHASVARAEADLKGFTT